jgi:predicted nucleotidyltransferase
MDRLRRRLADAARPADTATVNEARLSAVATRLATVPGVVGVVLGGSRARGTHSPDSDYDLGVYYRGRLDTERLGALAREVAGPTARVTEPGEWGPWVDGGGWLTIDGAAVDWIYRDVDRVRQAWRDAEQGRYAFHSQAGHPLGVPDFAYVGELVLGVLLADPSGDLAALRTRASAYPSALADALVSGLWEADFLIGVARKATRRADSAYVAGCLFRLIGVCAHALHGAARRWLVNEKGAVASAAAIPGAPVRFAERVDAMFALVDGDPVHLVEALDLATDLVIQTADACAMMAR